LFVAWLLLAVALLVAPRFAGERPADNQSGRDPGHWLVDWSGPWLTAGAIVLFVACGISVSAATGIWEGGRYRIPSGEAALQAAQQVDKIGACAVCATSRAVHLGTTAMLAELESASPSVASRPRPDQVVFRYDEWIAMPGRIR
jgi:hypothetical protein